MFQLITVVWGYNNKCVAILATLWARLNITHTILPLQFVIMSKIDVLHKLGVGRREPFDPFFAEGDAVCKAYKREGIVDIDDEDLCHEV